METNETHEKIVNVLMEKGPSLPIHIAKEIGLSSLFVSAYLSELANEKRIKISHLKVGGSPVYYLEEKKELLESFHKFLHPREIEAYLVLKDKKVLRDSEQNPAIRVALRSIRDFAIGFKKQDEIYWRYYLVSEQEVKSILEPQEAPKPKQTTLLKGVEIKKIQKKPKQKTARKKQNSEIFLEEVKSYLEQKNIELVNLEVYNKKELIARIQFNNDSGKTCLLFAYNKKRITDKELLKAYKKSLEYQLEYIVLFKGEFSKKLNDTIEAYKKLFSVHKL